MHIFSNFKCFSQIPDILYTADGIIFISSYGILHFIRDLVTVYFLKTFAVKNTFVIVCGGGKSWIATATHDNYIIDYCCRERYKTEKHD